ncbi:hypothetical protein KDN32_17785 [Nocardioides sp. J2M5]|uniref:hypothetical protein n=1 Tax=Nocardioides palaemonis TaxID=2829810 RepID=UPI001BAB9251|nr:hypothetical protein [Nocardioides palaemonis]MBS2939594.1 hypothetical protein [Nocardioides palaemonis]
MSDDTPQMAVQGPCLGGPLDGGNISIAAPYNGELALRGATVLVALGDEDHRYELRPTSEYPFQGFVYAQ